MRAELLDVVIPYNNPLRWRSRLRNFHRVEREMLAAGVRLTTVELAYGGRPFELPDHTGVRRVRLRTSDVLWHKENLVNLGFAAIPDWEYGAAIDGDMLFADPAWAEETVHALQLHPVVQISTDLVFLGPRGQHTGRGHSFMSVYQDASRKHDCGKYYHSGRPVAFERHGYPGGAWGYRRSAWQALGGLLDTCILGAGDMHMALGLVDMPDPIVVDRDYTDGYHQAIQAWRDKAKGAVNGQVGSVPGLALHLWHGCFARRAYTTRGQILIRNRFDPARDLVRDHQGLIGLAANKPQLRRDLHRYFADRDEDSTELAAGG